MSVCSAHVNAQCVGADTSQYSIQAQDGIERKDGMLAFGLNLVSFSCLSVGGSA